MSRAGSRTGAALLGWFDQLGSPGAAARVSVAFSGGVDSAVVLAAAVRSLGPDRVTAATAVSPALPAGMLARAAQLAGSLGVRHEQFRTGELDVEGYRRNGPDRCYFCKSTLLDALNEMLDVVTGGPSQCVVLTGTNADDVAAGWRPGIRAAAERGARTPLADCGLTKADVRSVAYGWGLDVWDRPASPCLSSRVAYGVSITSSRLARVDRAEVAVRALLAERGVPSHNLRVRDLGETARLEVDGGAVAAAEAAGAVAVIAAAGFTGPVEVAPFASGALNAALPQSLRHA